MRVSQRHLYPTARFPSGKTEGTSLFQKKGIRISRLSQGVSHQYFWLISSRLSIPLFLLQSAPHPPQSQKLHFQGALKPTNIFLCSDGTVKILDFGLAKSVESSAESHPDLTHSPTLAAGATEVGMIPGTAAYMAPQQARAKPVDKRTEGALRRMLRKNGFRRGKRKRASALQRPVLAESYPFSATTKERRSRPA